ncbi:MAG TPA: O-antigen ligase family protein [Gemmataceae bacterium]|nr:O-antigen ligase family protein [Gemmataceae bacterium]
MGFILFILVTATLLIRPAEQLPELQSLRIYESLIILCFVFSFGAVLEQFTMRNLETRPITICLLGLLIAVPLSHLSQGNALAAADTSFEFFKIVIYYVLLVGNITTVLRLRVFLACLGVCAVAFVMLAVLQYHEVIELPEPEPVVGTIDSTKGSEQRKGAFVKDGEYDPEIGQIVDVKRLRGTGIYRDPNDLSLLLTMGLFIALYGLTDTNQGVFRLGWLGPLLLFGYALSLTQSRGGFLGMMAGFMALFYARFGWRGTLMLGVPLLPVAVVLFGGRMVSISASEGTGQTRIQIWSDGIAAMLSAPIFGVGMSELGTVVGKAAHNSFLSAYAELGLFGGTFFLGAFFSALLSLQRLLQYRDYLMDANLRRLLPFLVALLASYGVGILSLSRVDVVPTYLILGVVTAAVSLAAGHVPALALRLDSRLVQRLAMASVAFLAATYMFVRVLKT